MLHNYSDFAQNEDVMTHMFSLLSVKELLPFHSVSSTFNLFASADPLWRFYTKRDFNLDIPTDIQPKKYYHIIKNKIAQEKEVAIYYCICRALMVLASYFETGLTNNKNLLSLFSEEQLLSVRNNEILSGKDAINPEELRDNNANEFVATVKKICYTKIDNAMVDFMIAKTETDFAPLFEDAPLPSSPDTCLTLIAKQFPLNILYCCDGMQSLKIAIWKHPEAINQLTQAMSNELYMLFNGHFMETSDQKTDIIKKRIDNLNWLLSYHIDVDKKVLFHKDNITTIRQAAHLCIAKLAFADHIVEVAKDERSLKKIQSNDTGYLMALLDSAGIIKQNSLFANPEDDDTQELLDCGVKMGLAGRTEPEYSHFFEIDQDILEVMTKITNMPTKAMNDQLELLAANPS